MFTGIVETMGEVIGLEKNGSNLTISIKSSISSELKVDQSVAHNGVCLTVVRYDDNSYDVVAIDETLNRSNLGKLKVSDLVNLERCVKVGDRLDGHIVQGHVDQTAICKSVLEKEGSWEYSFTYDPTLENITVTKGSITVNGVSLTVVGSEDDSFSVAIIPYTNEHTNFKNLKIGDTVNLEFDIIGKYVQKMMGR
ncbi:riboflavin synthase alpha chain [Flavobacteriaceae bacterium MAR_2010_188]|nr:riboflavin synthase alpha chain [Flavobacteriaceae bacterium MAR_2010_188]